jgi:hypothetical protein
MYGSSNSKKSSSRTLEDISSSTTENRTVRFPKPEGSVLAEQKMSYLKKMIALHQVPTSMTMMTQMMSMMNKNS